MCLPSLALNFTPVPNLHSQGLTLSTPQSHRDKGEGWKGFATWVDKGSPISKTKQKPKQKYLFLDLLFYFYNYHPNKQNTHTHKLLRIYKSYNHYVKFIAEIFPPQQL